MKKRIIIFCVVLVTLSLTIFGVFNWNDSKTDQFEITNSKDVAINTTAIEKNKMKTFPDFIYGIGPRFSPIKKGDINKAKSIGDFINNEQMQDIVTLNSVSIIFIINDEQTDIREIGNSENLTDAQLELLQSASYSTNFLIRIEYQKKNNETGNLVDSYSSPHHTIVPEKQAIYLRGKDDFMEYLKENSIEARDKANVDPEKLQPAKLYFTVSKRGTIENVRLDKTSNYPSVDKKIIELVTKTPGTWKPAENAKGEKVDQELVISFGLMGC